jgi:REP element-mobilizing transposase RayT
MLNQFDPNARSIYRQWMTRARKTHDQLALFRNGGKRRGAGRKPSGARACVSRHARPVVEAANGLHVTLRVRPEVGRLRKPRMYRAIRAASRTAARREDFRIVHLSIQGDHLHLVVEAEDKRALARGMQGFQISAARNINAEISVDGCRRRGRVFSDRYHLVVIGTPTQMRRALSYCLNNWRKHGEDREFPGWRADPYATGFAFEGWRERERGEPIWPAGAHELIAVRPARSWLVRAGWRKAGAISVDDVPGGD